MSRLKDLNTPVFYAEGQPGGVSRENYRLKVSGLPGDALREFTFARLEGMPFTTADARLTSVSGWSVRVKWQGVRFTHFLQALEPRPEASHVVFESFGGYTTCVPLSELQQDNDLLCFRVDGEYLEPEYGGPVRMVIPQLWGYKSIKGLSAMTFGWYPEPGYWETRGYPDDAQIEPGFTRDVNTGQMRRIRGGEVTEF
jgi:DMSO/TMAO reductase YedYZ molybdopterin-dependent catalytic subunit